MQEEWHQGNQTQVMTQEGAQSWHLGLLLRLPLPSCPKQWAARLAVPSTVTAVPGLSPAHHPTGVPSSQDWAGAPQHQVICLLHCQQTSSKNPRVSYNPHLAAINYSAGDIHP